MQTKSTWLDSLEIGRTWLIGGTLLFCMAAWILTAKSDWLNPDGYWHLRMGMDWVESGLSPWRDHYSVSFEGQAIHQPPVLFQVSFYALVNLFGEYGGGVAMKLVAFGLLVLCAVLWMRQIRAPALAYLIVLPMMVLALQSRAMVRPEVFSYPLCIIAFMLYHRTRLQLTASTMLPIVGLMLFWTNYHTSSIFGYIIFFGLFIDIAIRLVKERSSQSEWIAWAAWGAVLTAVGFLNPSFSHVVIGTLRFPDEFRQLITEYVFPMKYLRFAPTYFVIAFGILSLLLAVKQRKIGYMIILVVFFHEAMTSARLISPTSIVCQAMFAHLLTDARLPKTLSGWPKPARTALGLFVIGAIASILFHVGKMAKAYSADNVKFSIEYPDHLLNYVQEQNLQGRVLNNYGLGGYLIYHLYPKFRVVIDGRTGILYPMGYTRDYFETLKSPEKLHEQAEALDIEYAIVENSDRLILNLYYAGYRLEYPDSRFSLFKYETGNYTTLGYSWVLPYCWDSDISNRLLDDAVKAKVELPGTAQAIPLAEFAVEYIRSEDKAEFLRTFDTERLTTDASRRFYIYRALENYAYDNVAEAFSVLHQLEYRDVLAQGLLYLRQGDSNNARKILEFSTRLSQSQVELSELVIQQALLAALNQEEEFEGNLAMYFHNLTAQIGDHALHSTGADVPVTAFCDPMLRQMR